MPREDNGRTSDRSGFYGRHYTRIDSELAAEIRREVFGDDIGQESWRTGVEQTELAGVLSLTSESRVFDVACGAGGPSLALVERTGCRLTGLDIELRGIAHASSVAAKRGLADRANFMVVDCGEKLPQTTALLTPFSASMQSAT